MRKKAGRDVLLQNLAALRARSCLFAVRNRAASTDNAWSWYCSTSCKDGIRDFAGQNSYGGSYTPHCAHAWCRTCSIWVDTGRISISEHMDEKYARGKQTSAQPYDAAAPETFATL